MTKQEIESAVMFVDIAGSTRLYEALGDERAQGLISSCLDRLSHIIQDFGGTVIKNIGDEVMCRFDSADLAVGAASLMHDTLAKEPIIAKTVPEGAVMSVRSGLHYGSVIMESGDLFGDGVNVASRMTAIAKAGQIITTAQTIDLLSKDHQSRSRIFDRIMLKGKTDKVDVYEILWHDEEDLTKVVTAAIKQSDLEYQKLWLMYRDNETVLDKGNSDVIIGRDNACDIVVAAGLASRVHCTLKYSRGKFVLCDCSTNGTYVRHQEDSDDIYIKREELPLWGRGMISLGKAIDEENEHLIFFNCD